MKMDLMSFIVFNHYHIVFYFNNFLSNTNFSNTDIPIPSDPAVLFLFIRNNVLILPQILILQILLCTLRIVGFIILLSRKSSMYSSHLDNIYLYLLWLFSFTILCVKSFSVLILVLFFMYTYYVGVLECFLSVHTFCWIIHLLLTSIYF